MSKPLVSILTPSYNQGRWLGDCLTSVARQTYGAIEHIVMDGASTDDSVLMLKKADESVRWRSERDSGQSHAINKAYAASRGQIIGWINSDDALYSVKVIETVVETFVRNPRATVVYGHAVVCNGDGWILQVMWAPGFSFRALLRHNYLVQPAVFLRRANLDGQTLVDESLNFGMDYDLWLRLASQGHQFVRLPQILAVDRHYSARKSLHAAAKLDDRTLLERYGAGRSRKVRKLLSVSFRLAGTRQALTVRDGAWAFSGRLDSPSKLVARQLTRPMAKMPGVSQASVAHLG